MVPVEISIENGSLVLFNIEGQTFGHFSASLTEIFNILLICYYSGSWHLRRLFKIEKSTKYFEIQRQILKRTKGLG